MYDIFSCNQKQKLSVIFEMIDFNADGQISADDVRMILNHLLLSSQKVKLPTRTISDTSLSTKESNPSSSSLDVNLWADCISPDGKPSEEITQ